jgi:lipopolysaccharide export system protein LptC
MAAPNRYSTLIAWTKVVLPLIALALLSTLFLFSRTPNPENALPDANIDVAGLAQEQRLSRPRFAGTLIDGRAVTLNADTAVQQGANPNLLHLTNVESDFALGDDENALVSSQEGDFDLARQMIELAGRVTILTTSGYQLLSDQVSVAMTTMNMISPGAVTLTGSGLMLEAGAMELTGSDGQALFSFTGGVRLLYDPAE